MTGDNGHRSASSALLDPDVNMPEINEADLVRIETKLIRAGRTAKKQALTIADAVDRAAEAVKRVLGLLPEEDKAKGPWTSWWNG